MQTVDDKTALKAIASNVASFRRTAGLSLSEVARRCGTYPRNIQSIEKASHMPGSGLLKRLSECFEVSTDAFYLPAEKKSRQAS